VKTIVHSRNFDLLGWWTTVYKHLEHFTQS